MSPNKVSRKLLQRLPVYLNYLKSMTEDSPHISATSLARALDMGEVQVRKDLARVSSTGRCRTGRSREQLILDLEQYLDRVCQTGTVIVGAGRMGQALLDHVGFEKHGLNIMAAFDIRPAQKESASGKPIYHMNRLEAFCKCYDVHIGIIAVPADQAQAVCDCMIACGIKAIWNLAPVPLKVPKDVLLRSENLASSFSALRTELLNTLL